MLSSGLRIQESNCNIKIHYQTSEHLFGQSNNHFYVDFIKNNHEQKNGNDPLLVLCSSEIKLKSDMIDSISLCDAVMVMQRNEGYIQPI